MQKQTQKLILETSLHEDKLCKQIKRIHHLNMEYFIHLLLILIPKHTLERGKKKNRTSMVSFKDEEQEKLFRNLFHRLIMQIYFESCRKTFFKNP